MISFSLLTEIFKGFHVHRWNDRIRPADLIEMDKHAHKMMIAWCLGKYEEERGAKVNWLHIIKSGLFELLRRIVIADIKSPIFHEIKKNKTVFEKLNNYIYGELEGKINSLILKEELAEFLYSEQDNSDISTRILDAAHIYSSYWEFKIIRKTSPFNYQNTVIETDLLNRINRYADLNGIKKITHKHTISNFIDLCGQLRFQIRWAQLPREPRTSVLGHSMMVAIISYFFARQSNACDKRVYNAFFGGLFHDLPETVTRDIISPVKRSSVELDDLIKELEMKLAEDEIFPLLEKQWHDEVYYFITDEFVNKAIVNGKKVINLEAERMNDSYNSDEYNPFDGELVRAADHLAAFMEAWSSCKYGIRSEDLKSAALSIKNKYSGKITGEISFEDIYTPFGTVC